MLKEQKKPRVLKPFIAVYNGKNEQKNGNAAKPEDRLEAARKIVKRVVERVKRI
jgi:hypothetical protein